FQQYIAPSILLHIGTVLMEKTGQKTRTADPNGEFSTSSQQLITMEPTGQQQLHTAAIYVTSATYGRSNRFTCYVGIPAEQTKNTDWFSNWILINKSKKRCEGRSACNVLASSAVFGDPCVGTYKYLDVIYLCEKKKSLVACEGTVARLHCEEGQAIYVTSATYGRTDKKTCSARRPADQLKNTECFTYAEEVGERCNGKQWCKVKASNYVFGDPCYGTYKYLEVEYICYGEFRLSLH
uniref:SUEL-type lectin domain-containing protein n=1 Tax=Xiphophorus maculatus TaxID=8083 RepID=A0A3B5Q472_XIPMA